MRGGGLSGPKLTSHFWGKIWEKGTPKQLSDPNFTCKEEGNFFYEIKKNLYYK